MSTTTPALNRPLRWLLGICAIAMLAACATGPRISTEFDPKSDFSRYQTWAFYEPISMEGAGYATFLTERIRADVRSEMERRGYRYAEASPDLRVNFQVTVQDRIRTSPGFYDPFGYGGYGPYGWGGWYPGAYGFGPQQIDSYREGTLVIDVVDPAQNRLVWTASATSRVSTSRSLQERARNVDLSISEIFKQFPFTAGSSRTMPPVNQ